MIGTLEILFILVILLLLFGPDKIPELARSAGIAMAEFKKAEKAARLADDFDMTGFDQYNREYAGKQAEKQAALFEKVKAVAEESGIPTEGRSMDELLALIEAKAKQDEAETDNGPAVIPENGEAGNAGELRNDQAAGSGSERSAVPAPLSGIASYSSDPAFSSFSAPPGVSSSSGLLADIEKAFGKSGSRPAPDDSCREDPDQERPE